MRRYWIAIVLFGLFVLEGTVLYWLIPQRWQSDVHVVPHALLVGILLVSLFKSRYQGLIYGLVFGLLQDFIYFSHALGVYSFGMGLVCYVTGLMLRGNGKGLITTLLAAMLGSLCYDALLFGMYRLFLGAARVSFQWAFVHEILPSMLLTTLLALLIYIPARKLLEYVDANREQEEK